jgi:hypothetical protein
MSQWRLFQLDQWDMVMTNSRSILPDGDVVRELIEPSTMRRRWPAINLRLGIHYLCDIQRERSQVMFPFLLDKGIARWRHSTKDNKSPPFKIKSDTPRQRIRSHPSNNYISWIHKE